MRKIGFILAFFLANLASFATHNRAGEITYCVDPNNPLKFHFTVTTYTDPDSDNADRCDIEIQYRSLSGTNAVIDTILRVNNDTAADCDCDHGNCGVLVSTTVKKNIYTTTHTFSGAGTFIISVNDPNRNDGNLNIPNSVNTTFFIVDTLVIDNWIGTNCTPVLNFPPIDNGCTFEVYQHNPGAVDEEGDSLAFSLIPCSIDQGEIPGYQYPNETPAQNALTSLEIDPVSGTVTWDAPQVQGEYNICILIEEFRNGIKVGTMVRDMQITIGTCDNDPPEIELNTPLCVTAGDTIDEVITATDENLDFLTLTSTGDPYTLQNSPATFDTVRGIDSIFSNFYWETNCQHVRKEPYLVYYRAEDEGNNVNLVVYETMEITVVAPAPENLEAQPLGYNINLSWDPSICSNAVGYKIYRKLDSLDWMHDTCETGVPGYTGYTKIGSVSGLNNTTYIDEELSHGFKYCYMVVACFADGAESYASEQICTELIKDVPVITHVTVNETDISQGSDSIIWSLPVELDTLMFPGPYHYQVYRDSVFVGSTAQSPSILDTDTVFEDKNLNTETAQHTYYVELHYNGGIVGTTRAASSVYLSTVPSDNQITLSWTESVPWVNTEYIILRCVSQTMLFDTLDTVSTTQYVDTGLVNGREYCYQVTSVGKYLTDDFVDPIINRSQKRCETPIDNVAPCAPLAPNISANCDDLQNDLTWVNPNFSCADDVVGYNIYYAPLQGEELQLMDSIRDASITVYEQQLTESVAGCYTVTAIDTFYNESEWSEVLCVDNCPIYELPLVFTPGTDGINDFFGPFPYRFVESIDIKIYNRWGNLVYDEVNPDIGWTGINEFSGKQCSSGVYFYVCHVNENRLSGIESRTLKGYIQLIREEDALGGN